MPFEHGLLLQAILLYHKVLTVFQNQLQYARLEKLTDKHKEPFRVGFAQDFQSEWNEHVSNKLLQHFNVFLLLVTDHKDSLKASLNEPEEDIGNLTLTISNFRLQTYQSAQFDDWGYVVLLCNTYMYQRAEHLELQASLQQYQSIHLL